VQAAGHAVEVLLCLGACKVAPPAAMALLSTLAKLLAMAHAPGSSLCAELRVRRVRARRPQRPTAARRVHANKIPCVSAGGACRGGAWKDARQLRLYERMAPVSLNPGQNLSCGGRQEALGVACVAWASGLLRSDARLRSIGLALPAELLPYAAAQLLPVLLLLPERVRALDLPRHLPLSGTTRVSDFLADLLVSGFSLSMCFLPGMGRGPSVKDLLCAAECLRPARGARRPRGVQGARARMRGPGALCRRGAAQAGRLSLEPAMCALMCLTEQRLLDGRGVEIWINSRWEVLG
jgi:hypothetical protein